MIMKAVYAFIIILVIFFLVPRRSRHSNITKISGFKKNRFSKQPCSYCKRKASQLSFYADPQGKVIGVCNQCKLQAERQSLLRL